MSVHLAWFTTDLFATGHRALAACAAAAPCIPLRVLAPDEAVTAQLAERLRALDTALRARGGQLVVRRGEVAEVLEGLHRDHRVAAVWAHALSHPSDTALRAWCRATHVPLRTLAMDGPAQPDGPVQVPSTLERDWTALAVAGPGVASALPDEPESAREQGVHRQLRG